MGLNSQSSIKIVDLLCEGPIDGIVGGRKGVYLDENALRAADGEDNVSPADVKYQLRHGTKSQNYHPQARGVVSNVVNINKEVGAAYSEQLDKQGVFVKSRNYGSGAVVEQVVDLEVDSVDLIFTVPRLFSTAQEGLVKGQLFDAQVFFDVFIQSVGSGRAYTRVKTNTVDTSETFSKSENVFYIEGVSVANYQYKISNIQLPGKGPWNIKVTKYPQKQYQGNISHKRNDAKDIDQNIFRATFGEFETVDKRTPLKSGRANSLVWTSIVENQIIRSAHPYTATVGMTIATSEYPSLPSRSYLVRGRKVQIPENATPRADGSLRYKGNFDGTLKGGLHWTTCPVCIFYDLVTNRRYGAGHHVQKSNLNWLDLYPLSKYCNELVDGEPRFACNVSVNSQAQAYTVLQDFASVFRGMMYWYTNTIQITADHGNLDGTDINPVHVFSNSNVAEGVFNYSGTSLKTRSTSIKVRYIDPENFYKPNIVCVEDSSLIEKYGYQTKEILAFACTSKKQARRLGLWMLKSEELDGLTVTFSVGLEGALVLPGQIFMVQDESRAGQRYAGRISNSNGVLDTGSFVVSDVSTSVNEVVTDQDDVLIPTGSDPKITCVLRNGKVETKPINKTLSGGNVVTVSESFSAKPLEGSMYSMGSNSVREQKFRCVTVSDQGDGVFAIVGVEHNDSIYDAVEDDDDLEFLDVTVLDQRPSKPIF